MAKDRPNYFKKAHVSKNIFVWSFLAYPLLLFLIFYVDVNINSILNAFKNYQDGTMQFVGFDNFKEFINRLTSDGDIIQISIKNSLIIYLVSLLICMPLYIFFSYLLFKKVKGHRTILFLIMAPTILSSMVFALIFKYFTLEGIGPLLSINYRNYILEDIDRTYAYMLEKGATTFWETIKGKEDFDGAGSLCHGWSALPIYYYHTLLKKGEE